MISSANNAVLVTDSGTHFRAEVLFAWVKISELKNYLLSNDQVESFHIGLN